MEAHLLIPLILVVIAVLDYLMLPNLLMKPLRNLKQMGKPAEATIRQEVKGHGWRYEYEVNQRTLSGIVTEQDLDNHKGFQTGGDLSGETINVVYDPAKPNFSRLPVQIDYQLKVLDYVIKGAIVFLMIAAIASYFFLKPGV